MVTNTAVYDYPDICPPHPYRMTILPPTDKLKILLDKVKAFHQRFTEQYS